MHAKKKSPKLISTNTELQRSPFSESRSVISLVPNRSDLRLELQSNHSEPQILFKFFGEHVHSLWNRQLKLKNESSNQQMQFKIRSNNPQHYRVHPYRAIIDPGKTIQISIQLLISPTELPQTSQVYNQSSQFEGDNSHFYKYCSDKFLIEWWQCRRIDKEKTTTTNFISPVGRKMLKVKVEVNKEKQQIQQQRQSKVQNNEVDHNVVDRYRKELACLEENIAKYQMQRESNRGDIHLGMLVLVSALSFAVGVWVAM